MIEVYQKCYLGIQYWINPIFMKTNKLFSHSLLALLLLASVATQAQNAADLSAFLAAGKQDASNLIAAYTAPVVKATSFGLTGGWYHTAKTHKKLGIDFGVTLNAVFTPTSDNYFQPKSFLSSSTTFVNTTNPGSQNAPTIVGPKESTNYIFSYNPGNGLGTQTATVQGPQGLDLKGTIGSSVIPVPMVQLGIGTIKNTDLKIRLVPTINNSGTSISMFGVGLLHDVKQYFPGIKLLPFDLSILAGYNSFKGVTSLVSSGNLVRPDSPDGKVTYTLNSWVGQILISKKVAVLTFYAGVGYGSVATKVNVTGTYTIKAAPAGSFPITDPVSINFTNSSPKLTAGMRLKLGPIYLNGDYTVQTYSSVSIGMGVSVR